MGEFAEAKAYAENLNCEVCDLDTFGQTPGNRLHADGGFDPAPSWQEYISLCPVSHLPYILAAAAWVRDVDFWVGGSEFSACNYLHFSDGVNLTFSWRAYGDFLQAVVNQREGYMAYYSSCKNPLGSAGPIGNGG